jgi:hypothetical protein
MTLRLGALAPARPLKLALSIRSFTAISGSSAADLLEALGVLAPDEHLKRVAEREVGRQGVVDHCVDDHGQTMTRTSSADCISRGLTQVSRRSLHLDELPLAAVRAVVEDADGRKAGAFVDGDGAKRRRPYSSPASRKRPPSPNPVRLGWSPSPISSLVPCGRSYWKKHRSACSRCCPRRRTRRLASEGRTTLPGCYRPRVHLGHRPEAELGGGLVVAPCIAGHHALG